MEHYILSSVILIENISFWFILQFKSFWWVIKNNQNLHRTAPGKHTSCKIYSFNSMRFIVTGNDVCSVPALSSICITSAAPTGCLSILLYLTRQKKSLQRWTEKKYWHWNSLLNRFHISPLNGFHSACHTWNLYPPLLIRDVE